MSLLVMLTARPPAPTCLTAVATAGPTTCPNEQPGTASTAPATAHLGGLRRSLVAREWCHACPALGSALRHDTSLPRPDGAIVEAVREALHRTPHLGCVETLVQAHQGSVTLAGTVHSLRARQEAAHAAYRVPGVRNVHNLLKVRPTYLVPTLVGMAAGTPPILKLLADALR